MTIPRLSRRAAPFGARRRLIPASVFLSSAALSTPPLAPLRSTRRSSLLRPLLVATAVAGALGSAGAQAFTPFVVRDIRVEGIQRTDAGTVFSYLPVKVGETFTDDKATAALKALYATGFFKDVRIDVDKRRAGRDRRGASGHRQRSTSPGMKEFDKDTLKKALRDIGRVRDRHLRSLRARAGRAGAQAPVLDARQVRRADLTTTVTPLERNRVSVTFNVDEGDVATIKQIHIVGNNTYQGEGAAGRARR